MAWWGGRASERAHQAGRQAGGICMLAAQASAPAGSLCSWGVDRRGGRQVGRGVPPVSKEGSSGGKASVMRVRRLVLQAVAKPW